MRTLSKADVDDVPRWALWLVAVACFGPLALTWLLGVLLVPFWIGALALQLAEPERFADPSASIWDFVLPVGLVIGGFIGIIGLVRVLTLSRRERPESHRVFTLAMVAVGFTTLLVFHRPFTEGGLPDFTEVFSVAGLVYFVLPYAGGAWLLRKSRKFLLAAR